MDPPFIRNLEGRTLLHLCSDEEDQKSINVILKELAYSHIGHHALEIVDLMDNLVLNPTPALLEYLEKRFVQTEWTKSQVRGGLRQNKEGLPYAVMTANPWVS